MPISQEELRRRTLQQRQKVAATKKIEIPKIEVKLPLETISPEKKALAQAEQQARLKELSDYLTDQYSRFPGMISNTTIRKLTTLSERAGLDSASVIRDFKKNQLQSRTHLKAGFIRSQELLAKYQKSILEPSKTSGSGVKIPAGYSSEAVKDVFYEYSKTNPQRVGESAYDYANRITSLPEYQRKISEIVSQPSEVQKMQTFATSFGYETPTQYGKLYSEISPTPSTPFLKGGGGVVSEVTPSQEQIYTQYVSRTPIEQIFRERGLSPELVTKPFFEIAKELAPFSLGMDEVYRKQLTTIGVGGFGFGFKPEGYEGFTAPTPEEIERRAISLGTGALFGFFSPAFMTGTYSFTELEKQSSKNRFEALAKLENLEKQVAKKGTTKEQLELLKKLKSTLKTEQEFQGFKQWVESLLEKQIIKPIKIDITKGGSIEVSQQIQKIFFEITGRVPQLKAAGLIGGGLASLQQTQFLEIQPEKGGTINWVGREPQVSEVKFRQVEWVRPTGALAVSQYNVLTGKIKPAQEQIKRVKETEKAAERTLQTPGQSLFLRQAPRQLMKESQIQRTIQKQKQPGKKLRQPRERMPPLLFAFGKEKKKKLEVPKDFFSVFVKKKGKDILIGEFGTLSEAKTKLFKELKTTLRASGFVSAKGKKVKLDWFGEEWRPSKKDPFRIVQKRGFRLGTPSEVFEIMTERKKYKGKKPRKRKVIDWFS